MLRADIQYSCIDLPAVPVYVPREMSLYLRVWDATLNSEYLA